jgi:1-deoxy-D-xylulose-5-phosphate synthase
VEEGIINGGFGSAVREVLDKNMKFDVRFKSIGLPLDIYPAGEVEQIKAMLKLDAEGLAEQIREFIARTAGEQ